MDFVLPEFNAAVKLDGKQLVLIDPDTFKTLSKWLFFKNKKRNIIDQMSIQMTVENNQLHIYPFIFDIDRYRLGVQGYNDFALNFKYHIAVLKSPLPFKFGINISANPDKMKIRLMRQISNIFRRGIREGDRAHLRLEALRHHGATPADDIPDNDTLSPVDSTEFIYERQIEAPVHAATAKNKKVKKDKKDKSKNSKQDTQASRDIKDDEKTHKNHI